MKTTAKSKLAEQRAQYEVWYDEQVRLGLEDIEAGRVVSHEEVVKHTAKLLVPPRQQRSGQHHCFLCRNGFS